MLKAWKNEIVWEKHKSFHEIVGAVKENGFEVRGYREYVSKTDVLLEKDGIQIVMPVYNDCAIDVEGYVRDVIHLWELKRDIAALQKG